MIRSVSLSAEAEKLMPALQALSNEDRLRIASRLLANNPDSEIEPDEVVDTAWNDEIRRRVEEIKSGKVIGIPAEKVDRLMDEEFG